LQEKILEIFYEEFIKFVPPHLIKQIEDKKIKDSEETETKTKIN
jgi:hypothetical protein